MCLAYTLLGLHSDQDQDNDSCIRDTGDDESNNRWGDKCTLSENVIRIAFQNIQGLPIDPYADKHTQIATLISQLHIDSLGIAELNLNFSKLPSSAQWRERFKGIPHKHTHYATNFHNTTREKILYGGVAQVNTGTLAHRAVARGEDPSGLGRWVWSKFTGRHGITLRIISGYRPTTNCRQSGPLQVGNQHETYFLSLDDDRPARAAFLADLEREASDWLRDGDLLVIGLDANEHVRQGDVHRFAQRLGLLDAHQGRHPYLPTAATCSKTRNNYPIDGIWISPALEVSAAGYLGFDDYPIGNTDHRLLWIDLTVSSCFGFQPPSAYYRAPRRLILNDPRVVNRYNKLLTAEHRKLRLPQRAYQLHQQLPRFGSADQLEYEKLAILDLQSRRYAERHCRKLRMGKIPYSDRLHQSANMVQLWSLLKKKFMGLRTSRKKIRRLMRSVNQMDAFTKPLSEVHKNLQLAKREYKATKKDGAKLRQEFQERLLRAQAKHRGTRLQSQIKASQNAERQRTVARRVKQTLGKGNHSYLKMLDEPCGTGRRLCQTRDMIEAACQQEGLRRFSQTRGTPFTQEPLLSLVGPLGEGPGVTAILDGSLDMTDLHLDPMTKKFIQQLKRPEDVPTLDTSFLSLTDHIQGWRKMRATTSASPHGPGFIDYIAGSRDSNIAQFDAIMASLPFYTGYAPLAWSKATDVMIPKKADSILVEHLRIIILYHALFNQGNKRIGRSLTRHAELHNQIPWEAYGSRHQHRAVECALNKVLTTDILRQTHRPGVLCSNDAKSCYDRILHNVGTLCMRRLGLSPETCHVMFGTLQQVRHYVRTTYGDSASYYQGIEYSLQGIGQGNGAGPAIWLIVSIPIINMLKAEGFGFHIRTPISAEDVGFVCYTFVDDTDLIHSPEDERTVEHLITDMQSILDHWEGGLRATGGALVPTKSYWYLIHFYWLRDKWHYSTIAQTPGSLCISDAERQPVLLDRLEVSEARETLGIYLAIDGNQSAEFDKLRSIATRWADQVRCGRLTTVEAWFSLNHTVMKSLEYPLMATCLSKRQCDKLMTILLQAALPCLHVSISFPNQVRFGPQKYHGLGIPHLWTTQGIEKVWTLLKHGDSANITGSLLRTLTETTALEIGVPGNIFLQPYATFGHLATSGWVKNLWEFTDYNHLRLAEHTAQIPLQCEQDLFLMPHFASQRRPKGVLRQANLCRLWLQVLRLSDITSGDGLTILPSFWDGTTPADSPYNWPISSRPSAAAWRSWQLFLTALTTGPQHRLLHPLGPWTIPASDTHSWFYSPSECRLYHRTPHGLAIHIPVHARANRRPRFGYQGTQSCSLPLDAQRTMVYSCGDTLHQHTGGRTTHLPQPQLAPSSWALERLSYDGIPRILVTAIQAGSAIGVCDGSYKNQHGTAAFVLQDGYHHHGRALGCHRTPGHPSDQSSFRSEIGGILALVTLVTQLCDTYDISSGSVEIGCDCLAALTTIFCDEWDTPKQSCFDLIHATRCLIKRSAITWTWRHIKGHQDRHTHVANLDWRSQLNVEMDSLAKAYWNETNGNHVAFYPTDLNRWSIAYQDRVLSCFDKKLIYELCHSTSIRQYWARAKRLPPEVISTIDWEVCSAGLRQLDLPKRMWLAKFNTNTAPTGDILMRRGQQTHTRCPRCGDHEDRQHVLRCPDADAVALWHYRIQLLRQWCETQHTNPTLTNQLILALTTWRNSGNGTNSPGAIHGQWQIGWDNFLLGFLSNQWQREQQTYYSEQGSRRTGRRWAIGLFRAATDITWHMWQHRCRVAHLPTSFSTQEEHRHLNSLIQAEYAAGTLGWRDRDRRWFLQPIELLYTETLTVKQDWLRSVHATRERHHRRLPTPHQQAQQIMHNFFTHSSR